MIAAALILIPKPTIYVSSLSLGIMGVALFAHLTKLGTIVQNDSGLLVILVTVFSVLILMYEKSQVVSVLRDLKNKFVNNEG